MPLKAMFTVCLLLYEYHRKSWDREGIFKAHWLQYVYGTLILYQVLSAPDQKQKMWTILMATIEFSLDKTE